MNGISNMRDDVLPGWIISHKDKYPHKVAIVDGERSITYAEVNALVDTLAGGLVLHGVQCGDRVVLLLRNSLEFVISFFAIAKIGAIAVPLNVQYKEHELTTYLKDSCPKAVIVVKDLIPLFKDVFSVMNNKEIAIIGVPEGEVESLSYAHLVKENSSLKRSIDLLPEYNALCQYSSGSTGKSKKIFRTHGNLVSEADNFCSTTHIEDNDKILCVVPMFHAHGLGNCMLASIRSGATLVLLKDFNRQRVLRTLQEEKITIFPGVPFMFSILADMPLRENITLSSLRLCFSAGAPLSHETFQRFFEKYGVPIRQLYGSTETGSVSINQDGNISCAANSVGLPMKNVRVEIFSENGEILRPNEIGNIGIKSPAMTKGYAGMEDLTRECFRNGYFFPLDQGKKDEDGNLYIVGRKTMFINTGGNKVDPSEVEMLLCGHPKVKEIAVVGVKSHYGEEVIKAVVVLSSQCSEREIVEFCKGRIADFKIPRIIEFREEIPRSPLGKVLKKYLC